MNRIQETQNEEAQLKLLVAQRKLYSSSNKFFSVRVSIAIGLAILAQFVSHFYPNLIAYISLASIAYLLVFSSYLKNRESSRKSEAAIIQEEFDCVVLELPWNNLTSGTRVDRETIAKITKDMTDEDINYVRNWYPESASYIPIEKGRLICQRSNIWWDSTLRYNYVFLLKILLTSLSLAIAIIGIASQISIQNLVISLVPIMPFFELLISQISEHTKANSEFNNLNSKFNSHLQSLIDHEEVENSILKSREFQNSIFAHRKNSPIIPTTYYNLRKKIQELQMNAAAKDYADKLRRNI